MHISESFSLCVRFPKDSQLPPNVREQKAPITEQQGEVIHLPSVHYQCGSQDFICQDLNKEKRFLHLHRRLSTLAKAGRDTSQTCPILHVSAHKMENDTFSLTSLERIPTGLGQMLISSVRPRNDMAVFHITATQKQPILTKCYQLALLWGLILVIKLKQNLEIKLHRNNEEKAILHT